MRTYILWVDYGIVIVRAETEEQARALALVENPDVTDVEVIIEDGDTEARVIGRYAE